MQVGLHAATAAAASMNECAGGLGHEAFCLRGPLPRMRAKRDLIYK